MSVALVGAEQVTMYQFVVIRAAMKLYLNTGMKANRDYTPANMMAFATRCTGRKYKRNELRQAYDDLCALEPVPVLAANS